jgi:hypothetical protein
MFPNLLAQIIMYLCATTLGSWWSQWGVIRASHCHSSWRGWLSGTLWMILTRLWLHSFLFCLLWFAQNSHNIVWSQLFFFYLPVRWVFSLITLICSIKVEMHYAHAPADLVTSRWNNSRNSSSANMSHWGWTLLISLYGRQSLWFSWIISERQKSVYFIFTDHMNNFRIYTTA